MDEYVDRNSFHSELTSFSSSLADEGIVGNSKSSELLKNHTFHFPRTSALLNRMPCIAHTFQLRIRDTLQCTNIRAVLEKKRQIAGFIASRQQDTII